MSLVSDPDSIKLHGFGSRAVKSRVQPKSSRSDRMQAWELRIDAICGWRHSTAISETWTSRRVTQSEIPDLYSIDRGLFWISIYRSLPGHTERFGIWWLKCSDTSWLIKTKKETSEKNEKANSLRNQGSILKRKNTVTKSMF